MSGVFQTWDGRWSGLRRRGGTARTTDEAHHEVAKIGGWSRQVYKTYGAGGRYAWGGVCGSWRVYGCSRNRRAKRVEMGCGNGGGRADEQQTVRRVDG